MTKYIELNDKQGNKINVGDKVEFFFCADKGYCDSEVGDYTKMIDEVVEIDGEFYFYCQETGRGAFAWRHNKNCTVIGRWDVIDNN